MSSLCFYCKSNQGKNFFNGRRECSLCTLRRSSPRRYGEVLRILRVLQEQNVKVPDSQHKKREDKYHE